MSETASIRFQKVKNCGIYKRKARNASLGSFHDISNNIFNWSNSGSRPIQNTCTYEVHSAWEMEFLETYIVSIKNDTNTGDYFIAMWNRTHDAGDSVYALNPSATVDNISTSTFHRGNLPPDSIPGFATYFWLIPNKNTMATITFGTPRTGMSAFSYWLENFILTESRYTRFDSNNNFLGFASGSNTPNPNLEPRFKREMHRNPAKLDLIRSHRQQITGLVRRINLSRTQQVHESTLDRLARLAGLNQNSPNIPTETQLSYELSFTPSEAELEELIQPFEENIPQNGWEDVGIKFSQSNLFGASKIEWLSKSYAKSQINLDVDWIIHGQLLDMDDLKNKILGRREELIALIPQPQANMPQTETV